MAHRLLVLVLSVLLALPSPSVMAAIGSPEVNQTLKNLQRVNALAMKLRQKLNRSAFDLDALLEKLQFDSDAIITFVKEEIAFEPYEGLLRGPQGTLMSRAGNALDQAVLLAKLLRDAGYDARIKQGSLDKTASDALLAEMKRTRRTFPPLGDVSGALEVLQEFGILASLPAAERSKLVAAIANPPNMSQMPEYETFQRYRTLLLQQMDFTPVIAVGAAPPGWSEALRDYYWVEFRDAAAEPWTGIHPAFRSEAPLDTLEASATIVDTVPESLQHRVRLQFFIERHVNDKLQTIAVSEPWERPAANLVDHPVALASFPDAALKPENARLPPMEILKRSNFFVATLDQNLAPGASYFDLDGNKIDPSAAAAPGAGLFKQVGEAFADSIGALGGGDRLPSLTAHWLEVTVIGPHGEEQVYRRTLFDRIGPAARESGTLRQTAQEFDMSELLPFLQTHTFMVAVGRTPRGMAADALLRHFENIQPGLAVLIELMSRDDIEQSEQISAVSNVPAHWPGYLNMMSRFDLVESWSDNHRVYRNEPLIAIHSQGPVSEKRAFARLDIVHNSRRGVALDAPIPRPDPRAVMSAGVWETVIEGSLLDPKSEALNTVQVFESAAAQGVGFVTVPPSGDASGASLSPDARMHLKNDLQRGYAVVVTQRAPAESERAGWWRIDPLTGTTLGQLDDGRGVAITEFIVVFTAVVGLLILHFQLFNCFADHDPKQKGSNEKLLCCVLMNYAGFLAGVILGFALAAIYTEAIVSMIGLNIDVWLDLGAGIDDALCRLILE